MDGAGDADLRMAGDELKDERLLCELAGGFIGRAREIGVPGTEGAGEPGARLWVSGGKYGLNPRSGGAGLLEDILLPGKSILVILLC